MLKIINYLKNFQNLLLLGYISSITYLLYIRDVNEVELNKLIFAALVIMVSFLSSINTLLCVILFTIPLMCGLPGNYFLPFWIIILAFHFLRNKRKEVLPAICFATFFFIFEIIHYAFYTYEINYLEIGSYYCSLLLVCSLCQTNIKTDFSRPILSFCIGCCVLLTIIFLMFIKGGDAAMMVELSGRMGGDKTYADEEIMTLRTNANTIGLMSSTAIACILSLFYYKRIHFITLFLIISICFGFGLFSVSRTWAVVLGLIFLLYLFFQRNNKWVGYITIGIFIICFGFFYISNHEIINIFFDRFSDDNIQTGGNRLVLFEAYNRFLYDNFVYLIFGTSAQFYKEVAGVFNSTHNGLQQILVCYGLIGLFLFLGAYVRLLVNNYSKKQQISLLPMICVFIFLQTLQSLWPIICLYPIIAAFFVMKMVKQGTHN